MDTGIGISHEDQRRLFQKFFRSDDRTAREMASGTGLGLNIVKNLVELQGGHIWVESELRRGSTFHFTLPLALEPSRNRGGGAAESAPRRRSRERAAMGAGRPRRAGRMTGRPGQRRDGQRRAAPTAGRMTGDGKGGGQGGGAARRAAPRQGDDRETGQGGPQPGHRQGASVWTPRGQE